MRLVIALSIAALAPLAAAQSATSVLFIGNSFTFGAGSPVRFYRADTVTDLNNEGIGGVPALFKSFTQQAGLAYDVSLETRGGAGLDFHLANKRDVIASRPWDVVVMHGYSTLDADKPRDPAKLDRDEPRDGRAAARRNPKVADVPDGDLVARRPDLPVDRRLGREADRGDGARRARGVRQGRSGAPRKAVIPVGEAWTRAIQTGVADPNPYDGIDPGKLDLWTHDHYHGSTYGYYLEALVDLRHASPAATRGRSATTNAPPTSWACRRAGQGAAAGRVRRARGRRRQTRSRLAQNGWGEKVCHVNEAAVPEFLRRAEGRRVRLADRFLKPKGRPQLGLQRWRRVAHDRQAAAHGRAFRRKRRHDH